MEEETNLTERQKNLLAVLVEQFQFDNHQYLLSREIKERMVAYEHNYGLPVDGKDPFREINDDYHAINKSDKTPMIVIASRTKGYKLATKEEYLAYSKRQWKSIGNAIKRQKRIDFKASKDGQMDLFTEEVNKAFELIAEATSHE